MTKNIEKNTYREGGGKKQHSVDFYSSSSSSSNMHDVVDDNICLFV